MTMRVWLPRSPYSKRRVERRSGMRGAVFVESIIVISALSLGLVGLVFMRDAYEKRLGVLRLARGAVIAHSMAGCKANQPSAWVGPDLGRYTTSDPEPQATTARGPQAQGSTSSADDGGRAKRLLDKSGTTSSDGEGLLNPIASSDFAGHARVQVADGAQLGRKRTAFETAPRSRSFVTCGDEVKDGDYDKVLEMVKDEAQALFQTR
jgi:hypothetical protein